PGRLGVLEGAADVRIAGQVVDAFRGDLAENRLDLGGGTQVAGAQSDTAVEVARLVRPASAAAKADDGVRTLGQQRLGQPAARETGRSGQENAHVSTQRTQIGLDSAKEPPSNCSAR